MLMNALGILSSALQKGTADFSLEYPYEKNNVS